MTKKKRQARGESDQPPPPSDLPLSEDDLKLARQLFLEGLSFEEIAEKFDRLPIVIAEAVRNGRASELRCSFCLRGYKEVVLLIAGPLAYICESCLDVCLQIVLDEKPGMVQVSINPAGRDKP